MGVSREIDKKELANFDGEKVIVEFEDNDGNYIKLLCILHICGGKEAYCEDAKYFFYYEDKKIKNYRYKTYVECED